MRILIKTILTLVVIFLSFLVSGLLQAITDSLLLPGLGFVITLIFGIRGIWKYKPNSNNHKLNKDV